VAGVGGGRGRSGAAEGSDFQQGGSESISFDFSAVDELVDPAGWHPMATAIFCWVTPRGARYSSASISPGGMGAISGAGFMGIFSVIVDDLDIVRPAIR
jgi:hypothetical protein